MRLVVILQKIKKRLIILFLILFSFSLNASHNNSRYFPFLERPAEYITKRTSHVTPSLFLTNAATAFGRGGGNIGIPELYGTYDLRDVIFSLKQVNGSSYVNPIERERGPNDAWIDKSIRFQVNSKIRSIGFLLNYEQYVRISGQSLKLPGVSLGASLPLMNVVASDNFYFLPEQSDPQVQNLKDGEVDQLNRIRRMTNDDLSVQSGDWIKAGLGDLDLHASLNYNWDHKLLMRSIDLNFRLGVVIPSSVYADINYPASVSFMGDGHWTSYFDVIPEFELKPDWKVGLILGFMYQLDNTKIFRIPVYQEPAPFSALITNLKIDPGLTFKISPYFTAENLTDGVDFQVRYTYLKHNKDKWIDDRSGSFVKSYLNQTVGTQPWTGKTLTQADIDNNISTKKDLTKWTMHYISLELLYDSKEAGNNWILDPKIFINYDYQFSGNGCSKTHQFTLGVQAQF
ncbi:hypothetical protein KJ644_04345 [Candidatus Dependentiae bacterium]|nr:hypothetical protein [Candidatus Dependentiae bacterium]MBU4387669.1 hypothetical protein [Candidatus Dependentiae bacterium]